MIIDQQIEIEFGTEYDETISRAKNYVAAVCRSSWLDNEARLKLQTAEGGRANLLRKCLCYIIEEQDLDKGLRAFGNYIQSEYGRNIEVSLDLAAAESLLGYQPSLVALPLEEHDVDYDGLIRSDEERELYQTIADVGSIAEAIRLLDWPKKQAMNIWHRVYHRRKAAEGYIAPSRRPI